jgi:hypothetical protein
MVAIRSASTSAQQAAAAYLVATTEGFEVVLGMMAMLAAVGKAGVTPEQNRAALGGKLPTTT